MILPMIHVGLNATQNKALYDKGLIILDFGGLTLINDGLLMMIRRHSLR